MKFNRRYVVLLTTLILCNKISDHDCGVTKEQMEKTAKMFRQVCQPKHKIPDDILENGKNGIFPETKNFKCYVSCLMDMMQVTKKGKISYERSLKQIDQLLPDDYKPSYRKGLDACKDAAQGLRDHCESAYALLVCFYANNPMFIFP
ncbi:general odorant-binding protein 72-like [Topomyia yanbarensis]|uniref:general odorant-binding protein 72-like n=1 Tax=Topomyia yanbarensis TaxID=2498891 RepID=UPI00273A92A7|nr:general odorant-binding protein 72-like [Topomyia yanbarensis]